MFVPCVAIKSSQACYPSWSKRQLDELASLKLEFNERQRPWWFVGASHVHTYVLILLALGALTSAEQFVWRKTRFAHSSLPHSYTYNDTTIQGINGTDFESDFLHASMRTALLTIFLGLTLWQFGQYSCHSSVVYRTLISIYRIVASYPIKMFCTVQIDWLFITVASSQRRTL